MSLDTPLNGAKDWTPDGPLGPITAEEGRRLAGLERTVEVGMETFIEVGNALAEIRDRRLYRGEFASFGTYCQERWGLSRSRAHRLIEAAEVAGTLPVGNTPENERQARALAAADPAERADVMAAVAETGKLTAAAITDEIQSRKPPVPSPAPASAVETGRVLSSAPPASSPAAQVEPEVETDRCGACGDTNPNVIGGWCAECWQDSEKPKPAPKPPTLREAARTTDEGRALEALWKRVNAVPKALEDFPSLEEASSLLPGDSLEVLDDAAGAALRWANAWKDARKKASGLRLVEGSR